VQNLTYSFNTASGNLSARRDNLNNLTELFVDDHESAKGNCRSREHDHELCRQWKYKALKALNLNKRELTPLG